MRISELLDSVVVDESGRRLGRVYDLRLRQAGADADRSALEVTGLVVGPEGWLARAAHAWGYAEGRAEGPLVLRALTRNAVRDSLFVPAERVADWTPPRLRIRGAVSRP